VARVTPGSIEEAQALLAEGGRQVLFVGGGTALPPGPPVDLEISSEKLDRVIEYEPADQVVIVECGLRLAALQRELAKHGQRLALDPPQPDKATLGGIVAANSFGPLRTRFGSVRDLIIGVSVVRADGTRAKGGGKVVKTVAGFDLPKLMCGSWGTLAFIATVTFRVHPLPEEAVTLCARGADPMELVRDAGFSRYSRACWTVPKCSSAALASALAASWCALTRCLRARAFRAWASPRRIFMARLRRPAGSGPG